MSDFENRLKKARARLGWTQEQLAARLGVAGNTVARWERGEVSPNERVVLLALDNVIAQACLPRSARRRQARGAGSVSD